MKHSLRFNDVELPAPEWPDDGIPIHLVVRHVFDFGDPCSAVTVETSRMEEMHGPPQSSDSFRLLDYRHRTRRESARPHRGVLVYIRRFAKFVVSGRWDVLCSARWISDSARFPTSERMLLQDLPSREMLMTAQRIVLVDACRPDWRLLVYARLPCRGTATVELPVDSSDRHDVLRWQQRIDRMHLDG